MTFERGGRFHTLLPDALTPLGQFALVLAELPSTAHQVIETDLPPTAVHNGFMPPSQRVVQRIIQPRPQSGNRIGRRG